MGSFHFPGEHMNNNNSTSRKNKSAYGKWRSPVTPELLAERSHVGEAKWNMEGKEVIFLQNEAGRGKLFSLQNGKAVKELVGEPFDVGGTVGYGGGEFASGKEFLIFSNRDGCLYRKDRDSRNIHPITPGWGKMSSPEISRDQRWVLFVFSDGEKDLIGAVNSHGFGWPTILVSGADFYIQPAWHPSGEVIAWVEWDNPFLPWQASRVKMGEVGGMQIKLLTEDWVAGDEQNPATHPQFSPDGKWLSYIQVCGEWDQLVVMKIKGMRKRVLVMGEKVNFGNPGWVQGQRFYGWSADSQKIFYRQVDGGKASLWEVSLKNGKSRPLSIEPFTWFSQLNVSNEGEKILMRASSPRQPQRLVQWKAEKLEELTKPKELPFSSNYLAEPLPVEWQAEDGTTIHGSYFPPTNPDYISRGLPPLIIEAHAGPTMNNLWVFSPERAFFTSRGYAILAVDYRGSSGYGRIYQDALCHKWGIVDVLDCKGGAWAMTVQGLADPDRMAILGSSAGGFTVLNALIKFPGFFKAGVCAYPVCDLMEDMQKTHKLERFYNHYLIGDPLKDRRQYLARSPLANADKIQDPVAIFHGENDRVVSIDQSIRLAEKLKEHGIPHLFKAYPGEGHGFRKPETISDYYRQVGSFLASHVLK
jgi:dipeptidyl aminopeptidase/acylaminoacyl peptidase